MFKCAAVFSNNMVLQRGKDIAVFGTGEPNSLIRAELCCPFYVSNSEGTDKAVNVTFSGEQTVGSDGKWLLYISKVENYYKDLELKVSCNEEEITFVNVAVGEVFLAGGQSNMELELQNSTDGKRVLKNESLEEDVRFYYTQKRAYFDGHFYEDEENTSWQLFGDEWTKSWSAVGFFYGQMLAKRLNCAVGIIGCNWGGTSAACWMGREAMLASKATRIYVDEYDNSPDRVGKTEAEQIKDYEDYVAYHAEWDRKAGELYATVPGITWDQVQERLGKCRYPGPMNCASFLRPSGLHETMIKRVAPYTLQGFIYYQGESDDHRPEAYFDMMKALIGQWRADWRDESVYFILTQLPMHRYSADPDKKNWCTIRRLQERASCLIERTAMAVIIDQGEFNEIHPKYKARVGQRLALQALWRIYGVLSENEACGPQFDECSIEEGGSVKIHFKNCDGLRVTKRLYGDVVFNEENSEESILGFEVVDDTGSVVKAKAEITGPAELTVKAENVKNPIIIRYLHTNYGELNLYGEVKAVIGEPLPVGPFEITPNNRPDEGQY